MMYFNNIWDAIFSTRVEKFPLCTWEASVEKAIEECKEILTAPRSKRPAEYADAIICLFNAASFDGLTAEDIYIALQYKNMVNSRRKFELRADGTYQHIEGE